jgi:hypothetical protein
MMQPLDFVNALAHVVSQRVQRLLSMLFIFKNPPSNLPVGLASLALGRIL